MSVKTIRDWDARKIATAVATQAFELVLADKEAALAAAAKEEYDGYGYGDGYGDGNGGGKGNGSGNGYGDGDAQFEVKEKL